MRFHRIHTRLAGALLVVLALAGGPRPDVAVAQADFVTVQGDQAERDARRKELFRTLAKAENEMAARRIASSIWRLWFEAPDEASAELMREALGRQRMADLEAALKVLDQLVQDRPDWAEAWNQRATIRFLTGDFEGSLADIDKVLPLEPKHFGALSGEALILLKQGRDNEAQTVLKRAVEINPFLIERVLLKPEPQGKEI